jgi:hypothetical protein
MAKIIHTVTDKYGRVHTRTSHSRTYAFAIVTHVKAHVDEYGTQYREESKAEWASTLQLANDKANCKSMRYSNVEVIPAIIKNITAEAMRDTHIPKWPVK